MFINILKVDVYEENKIIIYNMNGLISIKESIYKGIIFWMDRKKNKVSQFKNNEIEDIQRWKGGIPNFKLRARMNKILKKLNLKKKIILYSKEKMIKREAIVWIIK